MSTLSISKPAYNVLLERSRSNNGARYEWDRLREYLKSNGIDDTEFTPKGWMEKYNKICDSVSFPEGGGSESNGSRAQKVLRGETEEGEGWQKLNYGTASGKTYLGSHGDGGKSPTSHHNRSEGGVAIMASSKTPQSNYESMAFAPQNGLAKAPKSFQVMISGRTRDAVPSQRAMEQLLEVDFSDVEDLPSRRKARNSALGHFRCEHPSCWDTNDKFRFKVFADLAHHYRYAHPNALEAESFPCDYSTCRRSGDEDSFTRKDAYRDHLREYHNEDMAKRHKTPKREQEWLASRIVSPAWWRCVRCLTRITVASDGWVCPSCRQSCEPERLDLRRVSSWKYDGNRLKVEKVTPSAPHTILSFDDFREPRSKPSPEQSSSIDEKPSASQTILPPIIKQVAEGLSSVSSTQTKIDRGRTADLGSLAKVPVDHESQSPAAFEYTHAEYTSHKIVPFVTVKQLGHGSLGSVDAVRRLGEDDGIMLARKVVRLPNMARKRLLPLIQQEVAVLRELSHNHIVQVVSTYETTSVPRQFGILISPAGDEDLSHFLERVGENEFPEDDIQRLRKWQYCLASAVAYIHSRNIRHKDIKPSNAICKGDEIYLTDFGSAHQFSSGLTSSTEGYAVGVTKMYSAPEVVHEDRRGRPADVYSLGCVFSEMVTVINQRGIEEFHDFRSEPVPDEPDRMTLCYHATAHKMEDWFATLCDSSSFPLISKMMAQEQKLRPSADEVLTMIARYHGPSSCDCSAIKSTVPPSREHSVPQTCLQPGLPSKAEQNPEIGNGNVPKLPIISNFELKR